MFSKFYDNKYAIVICGDVASYGKGPARPTGGCGTIGVLLGRGGSLMIENIRASFMKNAYDFYKPNQIILANPSKKTELEKCVVNPHYFGNFKLKNFKNLQILIFQYLALFLGQQTILRKNKNGLKSILVRRFFSHFWTF